MVTMMHDLIHTLVLVGVMFRDLKVMLWYPFSVTPQPRGSGKSVILYIVKFGKFLKQFLFRNILKYKISFGYLASHNLKWIFRK